ncbi:uncharacterized protein B0H18DRAFT_1101115 [Fomitopsis serialis]|uniref:uncharacterized protein n=1 Tax=Fomitopsis serialis TaxID=139415 RepID=UPI002007E9B7|nr:uncharacterized protein B0H18DRAFT_1101115 [Neoantrodia serialis]KAH9936671.1 hypothetical protein B0H18DRAFT_1101115 [Neoantrodia serialis]
MRTRGAIEDEIVYQSNYLAVLKTHLYTVAPISVLPPEVLCEVFLHIAASIVGGQSAYLMPPPSSWMGVSHVCRHWRSVALSCLALWSDIMVSTLPPTRTEWMAEVLERSKSAPLAVAITAWKSDVTSEPQLPEEAIAMVLSHMTRVLGLLDGAQAAPQLESLSIDCYGVWTDSVVSFPQLTHLTVTCESYLLPALMDIEELVMRYALKASAETTAIPDFSIQVALPRLQALEIAETVTNGLCLLNHLETPSLSRLCWLVDGGPSPESFYPILVAAIVPKASNLQTFRTLEIAIDPDLLGSGDYVRVLAYENVYSAANLKDFDGEITGIIEARPALHLQLKSLQPDRVSDLCRLLPIDDPHFLGKPATSQRFAP